MTARIEILAGIAASGKTTRLLEIYRTVLKQQQSLGRLGTTLWLSPTRRAARQIRDRLCDDTLPVAFAPGVLTFDEFANQILQTTSITTEPLSPAMQRMLLREIIVRLRDAGKLSYFASIADSPGFLDLVQSLIAELKRAETWPNDFHEACEKRGIRPRDRDLAEIYEEYQQTLSGRQVYDAEGRFWSARDALQQGHWAPFETLALVVVDGFTDFTQTQFEILTLLAERAERCCLSLLSEPADSRRELFARTTQVVQTLGERIPIERQQFTHHTGPKDLFSDNRPAGMACLDRRLFINPRSVAPATSAAGLLVVEAAGERGEVQWLAARLKQDLLGGVRPDEIVLAIRDLEGYHELVTEVFTAAGIPHACEQGLPLSRAPLAKALLAVAQLELEDWPFRRLMGLLDSSLFQPQWLESAGDGEIRNAAAVLRELRLSGGRGPILESLDHLAKRSDGDATTIDGGAKLDRISVRRAEKFLRTLSAALEGLRRRQTLEKWTDVLGGVISALQLDADRGAANGVETSTHGNSGRYVRDAIESLLADAARAERLLTDRPRAMELGELLPVLTDLLRKSNLSAPVAESGRIRILQSEQVRNLDVPYLYVAGLSERSFPRGSSDDCLYGESDRRQLNEHGLSLAHRSGRAQEEMLLFYSIVTRARRRLVLTYPVVATDGEPLSPSPYLTALRDLFAAGTIPTELEIQLDPIPTPERLLSSSDARVRGMFDALAHHPGLLRAVCDNSALAPPAVSALAAAEMNALRFHTSGFTNFEGFLENERHTASIARRYSPDHEFSATQLEAYAQCPFQFFLSQVLEVSPLPTTDMETDHGRRGTLVHDVLAQLHRQFSAVEDSGPPPDAALVAARFQEILRGKLQSLPDRSALEAALLQVEERLLTEWGAAYGEQWDAYRAAAPEGCQEAPRPAHFELAFGRHASRDEELPATTGPLMLGKEDEAVRITGRIDRVDVAHRDGKAAFTVIDYKTGARQSISHEKLEAGRSLQLALYTLAICRLELLGAPAVPLQLGYWHIRDQGFSPGLKARGRRAGERLEPLAQAAWEAIVQTLETIVPRLVASLRRGHFPVYNSDDQCTGRCPYHTVCRVGQIRSLSEHLGKVWKIDP